jgi:chaperonin GroES
MEAVRMKIRPLGDRIVVQRLEEELEKGGIIIPDTAKEKSLKGKIVAVGEGKVTEDGNRIPMQLKKGDKVLIGKYSGTEVQIEGKDYLIMREDDVLAIMG